MLSVPANYLPRVASILFLGTCICACAGTDPRHGEAAATTSSGRTVSRVDAMPPTAQVAASVALRQVGVAYRFGGSDPSGFDCSGLVQFAYAHAGMALPRTTGGLWQELAPVARDRLEVGDVLFFSFDGKMSHVGLYLGYGTFVHAPSSGKFVSTAELSAGHYRQAFIRGGRPR